MHCKSSIDHERSWTSDWFANLAIFRIECYSRLTLYKIDTKASKRGTPLFPRDKQVESFERYSFRTNLKRIRTTLGSTIQASFEQRSIAGAGSTARPTFPTSKQTCRAGRELEIDPSSTGTLYCSR